MFHSLPDTPPPSAFFLCALAVGPDTLPSPPSDEKEANFVADLDISPPILLSLLLSLGLSELEAKAAVSDFFDNEAVEGEDREAMSRVLTELALFDEETL